MMLERVSRRVVQLSAYVSLDSPLDPGSSIIYANDLDISPSNGAIYFTTSQNIPVGMNT